MMMTDKELKQKCGQRLREVRGNQKQCVFAKACNYSVQTISNIENGKAKLTPDVAHTIEKLCNVRAEYLLCEDDFKTEEEKLKYDIAYANAEIELNTIHSFSQWFLSVIKKYSTYDEVRQYYNSICASNESDTYFLEDLQKDLEEYLLFKLHIAYKKESED